MPAIRHASRCRHGDIIISDTKKDRMCYCKSRVRKGSLETPGQSRKIWRYISGAARLPDVSLETPGYPRDSHRARSCCSTRRFQYPAPPAESLFRLVSVSSGPSDFGQDQLTCQYRLFRQPHCGCRRGCHFPRHLQGRLQNVFSRRHGPVDNTEPLHLQGCCRRPG